MPGVAHQSLECLFDQKLCAVADFHPKAPRWHNFVPAIMLRQRAARLLAGAAGAASAAGACAAGGMVASSETRLEPSAEPDTRPIEILVHNISHSDMLVMLGEDGDENGRTFLARPVFNKFQPVTEAILHQIAALKSMGQQPAVVDAPGKNQVRYPIGLSLSAQRTKTTGGAAEAPELEPGGGAGGALLASADLGVSSAEAIWEQVGSWASFHLKGLGSKRQHALDRHLSMGGVDPATTSPLKTPPVHDEDVHVVQLTLTLTLTLTLPLTLPLPLTPTLTLTLTLPLTPTLTPSPPPSP